MLTNKKIGAVISATLVLGAAVAFGGSRMPGKYNGAVVYDRWGGCWLYSGVYAMAVAESAKGGLKDFSAKTVSLHATKVAQPKDPGDGRIEAFDSAQPAQEARNWVRIEDLKLTCEGKFDAGQKPVVHAKLTNTGRDILKLFGREWAPTLLARKTDSGTGAARAADVSDGPGFALITRISFMRPSSMEPRFLSEGRTRGVAYKWEILGGKTAAAGTSFDVTPSQTIDLAIRFDLPPGEYDFLHGYGGGVHAEALAFSEPLAFDVAADGSGKDVKVAGREGGWVLRD